MIDALVGKSRSHDDRDLEIAATGRAMQIRQVRPDEAAQAAAVHRAAFDERLPWLAGRYTPAQDAWYFEERVFLECQVWGALDAARLLAIVAFRESWIDQLYVLPSAQGQGLGASLLDIAKASQNSLRLWTFQRNRGACAFYEKRGFVRIGESDGSRNEEREPDFLYEWRAPG